MQIPNKGAPRRAFRVVERRLVHARYRRPIPVQRAARHGNVITAADSGTGSDRRPNLIRPSNPDIAASAFA
jgi:hypothetical protein